MVNQKQALDRLNKEKAFEEKIAYDIFNYFIDSLDHITDLDDRQKQEVRQQLMILLRDTERHTSMFNQLIQTVLERGEDNY